MNERGSIRVLIVDDDPLVREFLSVLLEPAPDIVVVGTADNGDDALLAVHELSPNVVLMDLRMPGTDGIAATRTITVLPEPPRILVMTTFDSDEHLFAALRAGAVGYILKTASQDQLLHAIRAVSSGATAMSEESLNRITRHNRESIARAPRPELTGREDEVLNLVAEGRTNAEIASHLFLSEATIKGHVSKLMTKLNCTNRTQLALVARRQ